MMFSQKSASFFFLALSFFFLIVKGPDFSFNYRPDVPSNPSPIPVPPRSPYTPVSCGLRQGLVCAQTRSCPNPNEYCSPAQHCSCKENICGDRVVDPGEECENNSQCLHYPNICHRCACIIMPEPPDV